MFPMCFFSTKKLAVATLIFVLVGFVFISPSSASEEPACEDNKGHGENSENCEGKSSKYTADQQTENCEAGQKTPDVEKDNLDLKGKVVKEESSEEIDDGGEDMGDEDETENEEDEEEVKVEEDNENKKDIDDEQTWEETLEEFNRMAQEMKGDLNESLEEQEEETESENREKREQDEELNRQKEKNRGEWKQTMSDLGNLAGQLNNLLKTDIKADGENTGDEDDVDSDYLHDHLKSEYNMFLNELDPDFKELVQRSKDEKYTDFAQFDAEFEKIIKKKRKQ